MPHLSLAGIYLCFRFCLTSLARSNVLEMVAASTTSPRPPHQLDVCHSAKGLFEFHLEFHALYALAPSLSLSPHVWCRCRYRDRDRGSGIAQFGLADGNSLTIEQASISLSAGPTTAVPFGDIAGATAELDRLTVSAVVLEIIPLSERVKSLLHMCCRTWPSPRTADGCSHATPANAQSPRHTKCRCVRLMSRSLPANQPTVPSTHRPCQ